MPYVILWIGCIGFGLSCIAVFYSNFITYDLFAVMWMNEHRTQTGNSITTILSLLGGLPLVLIMTCVWCMFLRFSPNKKHIPYIVASILGGAAVTWLAKSWFLRPRPDESLALVQTFGSSFPSAHSTYAAIIAYLMILIYSNHRHAGIIITCASLWCFAMGLSRVYLGAHYPTDVIAGWCIGWIWVAIIWIVNQHYTLRYNNLP